MLSVIQVQPTLLQRFLSQPFSQWLVSHRFEVFFSKIFIFLLLFNSNFQQEFIKYNRCQIFHDKILQKPRIFQKTKNKSLIGSYFMRFHSIYVARLFFINLNIATFIKITKKLFFFCKISTFIVPIKIKIIVHNSDATVKK